MNTIAAVQRECASFMEKLRPVEEVQDCINKRYDELFWRDENDSDRPFICTLCGEVIMSGTNMKLLDAEVLKKNRELYMLSVHVSEEQQIRAIEEIYQFTADDKDMTWTKGLALSPRGSLYRKPMSNRGSTCCEHCKLHAKRNQVTLHAIVNYNFVGSAPEWLQCLTPVELAFLTPAHKHGYCFSFTGGRAMKLKGSLVFRRVKEIRIAHALTQLESFGLTQHVLVMATSKMTKSQKKVSMKRQL
jgi:hypothetical protein